MQPMSPHETQALTVASRSSSEEVDVINFNSGSCQSLEINDEHFLTAVEPTPFSQHLAAKLTPNTRTMEMVGSSMATILLPLSIGVGLGVIAGTAEALGDALLDHDRAGHSRSFVNNVVGGSSIGAGFALPGALFLTAFLAAKTIKTLVNIRVPEPIPAPTSQQAQSPQPAVELTDIEIGQQPTARQDAGTPTEHTGDMRNEPGPDDRLQFDGEEVCGGIVTTVAASILGGVGGVIVPQLLGAVGSALLGRSNADSSAASGLVGGAVLPAIVGFMVVSGCLIHDNL